MFNLGLTSTSPHVEVNAVLYDRIVQRAYCRTNRRLKGTQIGQNRLTQKTASVTKTEKLLVFFTKTENQISRNNEKPANRNEHQNRKKTKVFWHKNRKTDLKNSQNRKTENPNVSHVMAPFRFLECTLQSNGLFKKLLTLRWHTENSHGREGCSRTLELRRERERCLKNKQGVIFN